VTFTSSLPKKLFISAVLHCRATIREVWGAVKFAPSMKSLAFLKACLPFDGSLSWSGLRTLKENTSMSPRNPLHQHFATLSPFLLIGVVLCMSSPSAAVPTEALTAPDPAATAVRLILPEDLHGVRVIVDGRDLDLSETTPVPPGEHSLRIEAADHVPVEDTLVLEAQHLHLIRISSIPTAPPTLHAAAWVTATIGVSLAVATLIADQTIDFDDPSHRDFMTAGLMGSAAISLAASGAMTNSLKSSPRSAPRILGWSMERMGADQR
jgi:hypothetical protein